MLHAILKNIGKNLYEVEGSNDSCLLALAHFLTDGGSPDRFKGWIESTPEGMIDGKVTFLEKYGDQIRVNLAPEISRTKATLVTNKYELLDIIKRFEQLIVDSPAQVIIRREDGKIVLEQKHSK